MMRPKSAGRRRIRPKGVPPLAIDGIVSRLHSSPERHPRMSWRKRCSDKALGKLSRKASDKALGKLPRKRRKKKSIMRKRRKDFTSSRKVRKTSKQSVERSVEAKEQQDVKCGIGLINIDIPPSGSQTSKRTNSRPISARFTKRRPISARLSYARANSMEYFPLEGDKPKPVSPLSSSSGCSTRSSASTPSLSSTKSAKKRYNRHSPKRPKALDMLFTKDKKDVIVGLESLIHDLQKNAKEMEKNRYGGLKQPTLTTPMSPAKLIEQIKLEHDGSPRRPDRFISDQNKHWWDMPFRDHIKDAEKPILKEIDLDEFCAEYSLGQLRYQSQQLLERRKRIEHDRTRGPLSGFYNIKGREFHREMRRLNRLQKKERKK